MELTLPDDIQKDGEHPQLETTYGDPVELEGRYEVDPIPGSKRFQGAWLVQADGQRTLLAYRPVPDHYRFLDKRVRVQGRPYLPGRDTQHMSGTHLALDSIELAPGEVPHAVPPAELPAPPHVRSATEMALHVDRWVQAVGLLIEVADDGSGAFGSAVLLLEDGHELLARLVPVGIWVHLVGEQVTVTSRLAQNESGSFELVGRYAIGRGELARCGMDPAW